jgi:hypothetical protein
MGLLAKLMKRETSAEDAQSETCSHLMLTSRWDSLDDIGHEDRATSFHCESCDRFFSLEETQELRRKEAERIRRISG